MIGRRGLAGEGAARLLRHHWLLWWIFAVGFLLAWLGSLSLRTAARGLLDHSFASAGIAGKVDVAMLGEILSHPTLRLGPLAGGSLALDFVFFGFLLFVGGGTLVVYREDRRLDLAEFYSACGRYFWRLVRLSLLSLVPLALVGVVFGIASAVSGRVAQRSPLESHAIAVNVAGLALSFVLFLCVRLWFDVAQARLVVADERKMWRTALGALRTSVESFGPLVWLYFRVSLVVIAVCLLAAWLWLRIPGGAFALSFLLLQAVLLVQLAARLWLRASVVAWYAARVQDTAGSRLEPTKAEPVGSAPAEPGPISTASSEPASGATGEAASQEPVSEGRPQDA